MSLHEIFERHGTDKAGHGYAKIYEPLLEPRRETIRLVLEVGIGTMIHNAPSTMRGYVPDDYQPGASLRAWREYFPNAVIWGVDTQRDTQFREHRIVTCLADTTDENQVNAALSGVVFDLIIDDGCHLLQSQRATAKHLWKHLNHGGLYVIEDVTDFPTRHVLTVMAK
jgi:hypothetical protein